MGEVVQVQFPEPPRRVCLEEGATYRSRDGLVEFGPMQETERGSGLWFNDGTKYTGFFWNSDGTMNYSLEAKVDRLVRLGSLESCFDLVDQVDEDIQLDLFSSLDLPRTPFQKRA